ncbi:hypothetical protein A2U01_0085329, partial [Trifolium medium]|nr:hypothetical protein [Trifolium medium]
VDLFLLDTLQEWDRKSSSIQASVEEDLCTGSSPDYYCLLLVGWQSSVG